MRSAAPRHEPDRTRFKSKYRFSAEQQLIIRCARVCLTDSDKTELRALASSKIDWDCVLSETLRQSIVPLLYRHLHAHCSDLVPAATLSELRKHYLLASARSLALAAELREIIILLEAKDVACLPYKGPVLALQAYGDIGLRTFTDLDLIVRPGDVAKARELLASRGYKPIDELTQSQEAAVLKLDHNLPLFRVKDRIVIELHWRVAPVAVTFLMPTQLLWDRATYVFLGGKEVRGMSPSDLIVVLSVHGTRHAWSAVEWITGIAELIRKTNGVCWDQVIREAQYFRVARAVRLALALAHCFLEAPLPDRVTCWIDSDARIPGLVNWVASRLFVSIDSDDSTEQWAAFKFELAVKDSTKDQIRDAGCRIFLPTAKDWSASGLPDLFFPIYHVLRPLRLLGRYLSIRQNEQRGRE